MYCKDIVLTEEQLKIVFYCDNMIINAKAGTGKTTTLIEYAKERPNKEILYLVFNKELRKSTRKKFPLNTTVHTVNSFIFNKLKDIFKNRKIINKYDLNFFINNFTNKNHLFEIRYTEGVDLFNRFNIFLNNDETIDKSINGDYIKHIYNEIISNIKYEVSHDILKKYFLENFHNFDINYDIVLIDEAQDLDYIMFQIINKIKAQKVYVGDKKQSIYGFRNTINIFDHPLDGYQTFELTNSFRFNKELSEYISNVTSNIYKENFFINGIANSKSKILTNEKINEPYVIITRTNSFLFKKAFELVNNGYKVSIPFDFEEIKTLIYDIYNLKSNNIKEVVNPTLKVLKNIENLKKAIKKGVNLEINYLVKIVEEYDIMIISYLKKLEVNLVAAKYADIMLITAHKSKGLEFNNVEIANDFKLNTKNIEEKNLYYVAITRAMNILKIENNKEIIK